MTPPQTLAQKLIAKAAGIAHAPVGDVLTCSVDLAMFHDSSGPRRLKPMLDELGAQIWDPRKVVLVMDHYVPEQDEDSRRIVRLARDTAKAWRDSAAMKEIWAIQEKSSHSRIFFVEGTTP